MFDKLNPISEKLLEGTYNIYISKGCMLNYTNPIDLEFMTAGPETDKFLAETIYCGQDIVTISDMVYNGYSVVLKNKEQINNIYNRLEQYIREAKQTYTPNYMSEEFTTKLLMLDNLATVLFENNRKHIIKKIEEEDPLSTPGYYSFGGKSDVTNNQNDFSPEEYVRTTELDIFNN